MSRTRSAKTFCLLAMLLISGGSALADGLTWQANLGANAYDQNGSNLHLAGAGFNDGASHTLSVSSFGDGVYGTATATGNAGFGNLHGQINMFDSGGAAGGSMSLSFVDSLVVTSATAAAGTPAVLRISASLHDSFTFSAPDTAYNCGTFSGATGCAQVEVFFNGIDLVSTLQSPGVVGNTYYLLDVVVGQRIALNGSLLLSTSIGRVRDQFGDPLGVIGDVDASNTANFYVDSLTDGVGYISDSGTNYASTETPEPASLVLFGSGLFSFAAGISRRFHA